LAEALKTFPDADGNGIPDIPKRYERPAGQFASVPSWSPAALLAGAGLLTYGALALAVLVLVLAALIVRRIRRRRNSKRR
jgi:4-hydroxybenzoate polyprenyltransferase